MFASKNPLKLQIGGFGCAACQPLARSKKFFSTTRVKVTHGFGPCNKKTQKV
jgi:hypothetical protein